MQQSPSPAALLGQVSDLDRATVVHYPDGRREIIMPSSIEEERERQRLIREHAAAATAARLAASEHDKRVSARVQQFLTTSEPEPAANARDALLRHLDRLDRARHLAAAAHVRAAEVEHAVARRDGAQTALDRLEAETTAAFTRWLDFGSDGLPPAGRDTERNRLLGEISEAAPLARLADTARFECNVADSACEALEAMTPGPRADVLYQTAQPIEAKIRTLAAELSRHLGSLAALSAATGRRAPLSSPRPIPLPTLPSGPITLTIDAAEEDQAVWAKALAAIAADPRADVILPPNAAPPPKPPRRGPFSSWR